MGNIRFDSRIKQFVDKVEDEMDISMLDLVTDVHRTASVLAPKDSRTLVKSGRISRQGKAHYKVIFGGGAVPYARRRHFENKLHPGTLGYLERPGDAASRNLKRYLGNL